MAQRPFIARLGLKTEGYVQAGTAVQAALTALPAAPVELDYTAASLLYKIGSNIVAANAGGVGSLCIGVGISSYSPASGTPNILIGRSISTSSNFNNTLLIGMSMALGGSSHTNSIIVTNGGAIGAVNDGVVVGRPDSTGASCTLIGRQASGGQDSVAVGRSSLASGSRSTALGRNASSGGFNDATALGYGATCTGNNQIVLGRTTEYISIPGTGVASSTVTGALRVAGGAGIVGAVYSDTIRAGNIASPTHPFTSDPPHYIVRTGIASSNASQAAVQIQGIKDTANGGLTIGLYSEAQNTSGDPELRGAWGDVRVSITSTKSTIGVRGSSSTGGAAGAAGSYFTGYGGSTLHGRIGGFFTATGPSTSTDIFAVGVYATASGGASTPLAAAGYFDAPTGAVVNRSIYTVGSVQIADTTASASTTTGALIVAGGVGIAGDVFIGGKLTVTGLIDPTGLALTPVAANPGGALAASTIWVNSGDSNRLYYGAAVAGGVPAGTTADATLRWSGSAWTENTSVKTKASPLTATGSHVAVTTAFTPGSNGQFATGYNLTMDFTNAATTCSMQGYKAALSPSSGTAMTAQYGFVADISSKGATTVKGVFLQLSANASPTTATTVVGVDVDANLPGASDWTVTNWYGLKVAGPSGATITNKYAIHTDANAGIVSILDTTVSTSITSGALLVAGGVGVTERLNAGALAVMDASDYEFARFDTAGRLKINPASTGALIIPSDIAIQVEWTNTSVNAVPVRGVDIIVDDANAGGGGAYGGKFSATVSGNAIGLLYGTYASAFTDVASFTTDVIGSYVVAETQGAGTTGLVYGVKVQASTTDSNDAYGVFTDVWGQGASYGAKLQAYTDSDTGGDTIGSYNYGWNDATTPTGSAFGTWSKGESSNAGAIVYGEYAEASGGDAAYGIYATASGATVNWAGYFSGPTKFDGSQTLAIQAGVDLSGGAVTLTRTVTAVTVTTAHATNDLNLWATPSTGDMIAVRNKDGGATAFDINGNGKNIDGSATFSLADGESATLIYDGTEWTVF